jgi:hypothetical protein
MKTVNTPIAEISFNEAEHILHVKVLEDAEMNLANAQIHYKKIHDLVGNRKYLALVDASNYFTMEKEAWQWASMREIASNRIAVAHYNSSFANTISTNYFKTMYNSVMPVQIFPTKEEAVKWLKTMPV